VSSVAHTTVKGINFKDLGRTKKYAKWGVYGESKLGNLLSQTALVAQIRERGLEDKISVTACHPGYSNTALQDDTVFERLNAVFAQSMEYGALPSVAAAAGAEWETGSYVGPKKMNAWGLPKRSSRTKTSLDATLAARLAEVADEMTGVSMRTALGGEGK